MSWFTVLPANSLTNHTMDLFIFVVINGFIWIEYKQVQKYFCGFLISSFIQFLQTIENCFS